MFSGNLGVTSSSGSAVGFLGRVFPFWPSSLALAPNSNNYLAAAAALEHHNISSVRSFYNCNLFDVPELLSEAISIYH